MKFKCADLDWNGKCRDFSPSYDESLKGYIDRDEACADFASDDDFDAYQRDKCKRYAHVYIPGGRSKQRYEDQVIPGDLMDRTTERLSGPSPDLSRRTQASTGLRRSYNEMQAKTNPTAPLLEEQIQTGLTRYFQRFHPEANWPFVNIPLEFPDTPGPLVEAGVPREVANLLVTRRKGRWSRLTPAPTLVVTARSRWQETFTPLRFVQGFLQAARLNQRGLREWLTLVTVYGRTERDTDPKSEILFRRKQLQQLGLDFEKERLFGTLGDLGLEWVNFVERKEPQTQKKIIERVDLQIGGFYVIKEQRRTGKITPGIRPVPAEESSPLADFLRVGDVFVSLEVLPEPEIEAAYYGTNQVASQEEWHKILRTIEPGVMVRLTVRRGGERITVDVPIVKGQKDENASLSENDRKDYVLYLFDRIEEKAQEESLVEIQLEFADADSAARVAAAGQILPKDKIIKEVVIGLVNREHSNFYTSDGREDITDYRTLKDVPFDFFPRVLAGMVRKRQNRKVQRKLPVLQNPLTRQRSVDPQEYFMSRAAHNPDDAVIARAHQLVEAGEHDLGTALSDAWSEIHQGARANPRRRRGAKTAAQRAAQAKAKRVLAYAAQLRRKNRRLSAKAACDQAWAHFAKAAPRRSRRNPEDTTMVRSSLSRAVDFSDPSMVRSALMNPYEDDTTMVRSALSRAVDFSDSTMVRSALANPHYSDYSEHHPVYEQEIGQFSTGEAFTHGIQPMNRRNPRKARKNVGAYEMDADYSAHHPAYEQFDGQFSTGEAWSHGIQPMNRRNPSSIAEAFSNPDDEESALMNPRKRNRKSGAKRKASPQAKRAMQLVHERGISLADAWEIVKSGRGGAAKKAAKKAAPKKASRKSSSRSRRNPSCVICHQPISGEVYGAEPYVAHKNCV